ncbi:hypothetical protein M9Y10_015752 [Tritrichomonas musculus]|uniref:Amino acid transporter transmembrane domain-containing protein n=1 Tax=Tritrichomonas musculus TaxID=1915356 RepID=A0ABR2I4K2_9EUKA
MEMIVSEEDTSSSNNNNNSNVSCSIESESPEIVQVKPSRDSTFFNTLMNLLNCLLGAGILSVPSSFASAGLIPSLFILLAVAYLCYISSLIDIRLVLKIECAGFDELIDKIMGKWGSITYSIIVIIFLFASMIAYLIIGCDTIISWFSFAGINLSDLKYRIIIILIYSLVIPVSLMIPKDFFLIGIFSAASVFCVIFYIIAVIVKSVQYFPTHSISNTMVLAKFDISLFSSVGVYALTFALPTVVITILHPYSPEYKKRRNVVMSCFLITCFMTIFPSIFLYFMFGADANGNILNSFHANDVLFTIVRVGFFLVVSFSFPVCGKSVMWNWSQLIFHKNHVNELKKWEYMTVFFITVVIPILLAMFLPQCKPIIAVGGAFGGCLACYTYPSILWIMASEKPWNHRSNIGYIIYAVFGVGLAIISTYQSVMDAIQSIKDML